MMSSAVLLTVLLAQTAAAMLASSSPAPWPNAFSVEFLTNVTTNSSDRSACVHNTFHYDWGLKMQAVVHGPGAVDGNLLRGVCRLVVAALSRRLGVYVHTALLEVGVGCPHFPALPHV